jgi:hypothetical protein
MSARQLEPPTGFLRRLIAAGCAALVLALAVFAASPVAHTWLHDAMRAPAATDHGPGSEHPVADAGHSCAIVLFAGGVTLTVAPAMPLPPRLFVADRPATTNTDLCLVSPRYLRMPERGPPARA